MKKKPKSQKSARRPRDPYAEREAQKYQHPIASREAILSWLEKAGKPLRFERLAHDLHLHSTDELEALSRRLVAMLRDGQLVQNRSDEYCLVKLLPLVAGTVIGHRDGFGFLKPDEGGDDVFLPPRQMRTLMHGDRALVRVSGRDARGRAEGSLVDVLERSTHELAGRYVEEHGVSYVQPDNSRIAHTVLVPAAERHGARSGQMVVVEITQQPEKQSEPIGRVTRILGERHAPGIEVELAVHAHGLPHEWPEDVQQEIRAFDESVPENAKQGRLDLRNTPLVTIDGEDARDFDDAVYCERKGNGFRVLVAIADVSHYVQPNSALDLEARNRGTSVYFPDRVIPMLPEVLSNGLCSIKPLVDRLCLVCEMQITTDGHIKQARFFEGLMRSAARFTYTQVAAMLVSKEAKLRREHAPLVPHLEDLYAVYHALAKARAKRGAIDFDSTETRIIFGEDRKVASIKPLVRNDAHRLIEECMIAANVEAAHFLEKHQIPTLYRVHASPDADGLKEVRQFLSSLGLSLGGGQKPEAAHYEKLLDKVRSRPDKALIQTVLLRSLSQAVYGPDNIGHFGLALSHYAHFTSPIRRYPDLLVHRAIRHVLRGGSAKNFYYSMTQMVNLGAHCSMTERRADEATRDATDWLKAEYMQDKVGEEFEGFITSVLPFGLFVQLKELYVEGLIHVTSLPSDYYTFDAAGHRMVGERSGRVFRLTDPIRVRVSNVNLEEHKIDFVPVVSAHVERGHRLVIRHAKKSRRKRR
jgi:ribonuclease R